MINIRLKFSKGSEVKYISHLDLMRTFMRAVKRADIPIAYSGGFNPHPEMSFGAPLSVGVASLAEYLDMQLAEEVPLKELVHKLNQYLPSGIRVLGAVALPDKFKSAMALITHARYSIVAWTKEVHCSEMKQKLSDFMKQGSIIAKKTQPKKNFQIKEFDIKPMIIEMNLEKCEDHKLYFNCLLASGSKANLKPEILMEAFSEYAEVNYLRVTITRLEVYAEQNGELLELLHTITS